LAGRNEIEVSADLESVARRAAAIIADEARQRRIESPLAPMLFS
jgi:hypothetical protein